MKRHILIIAAMAGIGLALILFFSYWRPAHQAPAHKTKPEPEAKLPTHITKGPSLKQHEPIYQRGQEESTEFEPDKMTNTDATDESPGIEKNDSNLRKTKSERAKRLWNRMQAIEAEFVIIEKEALKIRKELIALNETRVAERPAEEILIQYYENPESLTPRIVKHIRYYLEHMEEAARIRIRREELGAKSRELSFKHNRLAAQLAETRREYRAALADKD